MINRTLAEVNASDIQSLVNNSVLEKKTLSYIRTLPNSDLEKKDFLLEVASFANSIGGDIIFGISQDTKSELPIRTEGMFVRNVDDEILRLQNCIREGIEPPLSCVSFRPVILANSRHALLVRVRKSWNGPHRVTFKGCNRFFARNTNGKYELDTSELRLAFGFADGFATRIKRFREERISSLLSDETPIPLSKHAKVMLHLAPLVSFTYAKRYDIDAIANDHGLMAPMFSGSYSHRYNFDGFVTYSSGEISECYVQLFRNGIIEVVEGVLLKPEGEELHIPSFTFEEELIESLPRYLDVLKRMNVEMPIFVFLTLVGVKGYSMITLGPHYKGQNPIEKDILPLPEVLVDSYDIPAHTVLRPCFDSVWNACGFSRSINYDVSGNWRPKG